MNKYPLSALLLITLLAACSPPSQETESASQAISSSPQVDPAELARWEQLASNVTISRDNWGIAHI
ncbi:MAG: hypothetical protein QMC06_01200, partial [Gammaproteobacteria bacterium]